MKIYNGIEELIGNTPLVDITDKLEIKDLYARIIVKFEYFNPAGSAKDRVGLYMINEAEKSGKLKKGGVIIEPTSGNTGIGIAAIAVARGYRVILTMPETMSIERRKLLSAYGAEIVLTKGSEGMTGAVNKAKELAERYENSFIPGQFDNPANPLAHKSTTGPEIYRDTDGRVDILVAGVGTGGTLTGTGEYLKEKIPSIKVVAVEPADSPLLSEGRSGPHGIMGIGANFVPKILNTELFDEIITATSENSYEYARLCAAKTGFLIGISGGAALYAAVKVGKRPENKDKNIVVIAPDSGERYLSTPLFAD